ncbi:MAG: phosphate ABC transporter permease PstA [Gemmatimonadaceae bacterium]|nr:phosphate ABC transporter permease PstA [Gemmatimonadaceae bacterium]
MTQAGAPSANELRSPLTRPASKERHIGRRRAAGGVMIALAVAGTAAAVVPLVAIGWHLVRKGLDALSPSFFTALPAPVGEAGGGMANAVVGTLVLVGIAAVIGIPVGVGAGLYAAEHRGRPLAVAVRFVSEVLSGLPSILVGVFVWEFVVRPSQHFSALAGGIALAVIMLPLVARATEEFVLLVPVQLFETALALGYSRWRAAVSVVLRTAMPGIVTAVLVALARVAGETAPLLFTAFGNQYWSVSLGEPISALPLQIYTYAISPYDEWQSLAWAGALVLLGLALVFSIAARLATRNRYGRRGR